MVCCGGGLGPSLLGPGERGLEGGNDSVSGVPREFVLESDLRGINRVLPARAFVKISSSSFVVTFSEVSLGIRDFLDCSSSIDATALFTSLPRIGYKMALRILPVIPIMIVKQLTRTFATLGLCETLSKSE